MVNAECGNQETIPRWLVNAAEGAQREPGELWERINALLRDGWQPAAVRRELSIPEQQERSLEELGRKYRYRRVIAPMSRLRETLSAGAASMGPNVVKLFGMVLAQALSPDTEENKRQRAADILVDFLAHVERIGQRAEESEREQDASPTGPTENAEQMLNRIARDVFGLVRHDGK